MPSLIRQKNFLHYDAMRFMIFGQMLKEVCSDVEIESRLHPLNGESLPDRSANTEQEACLDISARGKWRDRLEKEFLMSKSLIIMGHIRNSTIYINNYYVWVAVEQICVYRTFARIWLRY